MKINNTILRDMYILYICATWEFFLLYFHCDYVYYSVFTEARTIQTGDGSDKLAYLFNTTLPGLPIVVYKGQEVMYYTLLLWQISTSVIT